MEEQTEKSAGPVIEIRSYTLRPGTRERFDALTIGQGLPLLKKWNIEKQWNIEVVAVGPSLHDEDSYYLIRAFSSLADLERVEEVFYSSEEWRQGPREAILACIERYSDVVLPADEALLAAIRQRHR